MAQRAGNAILFGAAIRLAARGARMVR